MDFTSTRAFSNHNIVVTTHGNILQTCLQTNRIDPIDWDLVQQTQLFKNLYSVAVNTIHMTSSENSRISAVDRVAGHNALDFLRDLQKKKIGADNRNVINHGTWEIWE